MGASYTPRTLFLQLHLLFLLAECSLVSAFYSSSNQNQRATSLDPVHTHWHGGALHREFTAFSSSRSSNDAPQNEQDETTELLEKARLLREQASNLEKTKRQAERVMQQQQEAARQEERQKKDQWKERYSVVIPILKDMGEEVMERVDFAPRIKGGKSRILSTQAPLPLGIVLGQDSESSLITVDDILPEGNGATIGKIQQGDILRAVTACQTTMETPTWQLLAGGIGMPKTRRFMFSADGKALEEVLNAVGSNRMDAAGRDVVLVIERVDS
ncbi:hypothetical protein HJC23_002290 [Cyclotella cryptica]|uniref:PDZ domain-containing protein n=1 Tax=Cyclotella cryptica TaxID=29204 RepID=A0ABD3QGB6_9STRA